MKNDRNASRLNFLQAVFFGVLAIALLGAAGPARAAFAGVQNGGFETPAISGTYQSLPPGSAGLSPWVISGDSIGVNRYASGAIEGSQWIDLQATTGKISQTLLTTPGATYKLSFKYTTQIGSSPKVNVTWGPAGNPSFNEKFTSTKSWVTAERTLTATSSSTVLSFGANGDGNNNYGVQLDAISVTQLSVPLATPSLLGVIGIGNAGATAYVVGRVDNITTETLLTVEASTCSGLSIGSYTTTTDKYGFFIFQTTASNNLSLGTQVKVRVTTPQTTAVSNCVTDAADNDYWPKALSLDGSIGVPVRDYIDVPGRGRWYKFTVAPSQSVRIKLSGLPADYDLAVFKDIGQAFKGILAPGNSAELLKVSAEFAPSVSQSIFSQSIFSQSIFSQSIFSQADASQSIFSQSIFSQSIFSQSIFSQSIFSQSIFSQSIFSQSIFSQSIFSQSIFSQSIFSPDCVPTSGYCYFKGLDAGGTVDQIKQAYSAAQVQSLVGVSATPGTADELVVLNTWNNTGEYYIRVSGRNGASDPVQPFTITVTTDGSNVCQGVTPLAPSNPPRPPVSGFSTVFVTDSTVLGLGTKLSDFIAARPEFNGTTGKAAVIDVMGDTRVQTLKGQAAARPQCPYAQNLVAQEIKSVIDTYRPGLKYVVILGNDATVPFFRYPDRSLLGEEFNYVPPLNPNSPSDASLRANYVLSQDAYGSSKFLALPNGQYPIPELAVGRLVETPAEIAGMLDAYVATNGVVRPTSSLVTGYDFLADAATEVASQLGAGTGTTVDTLITNSGVPSSTVGNPPNASWTADHLRTKLFGPRHDVVFLAGHFSANNALAADYTSTIVTTELAASTVDLRNSLVFSAGCHSGYNLVDADGIPGVTLNLDWAQAFARKGATLVAGTGYQYGDTDFLEYSERLYTNFSRQLRDTGNVTVGDALVKAKQAYLAATPDIRGIHEKALLEATLFGLPMLGVDMPSRQAISSPTGGVTPTPVTTGAAAQVTGLATYTLSMQPALSPSPPKPMVNVADGSTINAEWLTGPNGAVVTNPAQPTLPLLTVDVTPPAGSPLVLRGIGFLGGTYTDKMPMYPLSGAPTTEQSSVHLAFEPNVFYPNVMWTPNYFPALTGTGGTSVLVTPVQHKGYDVLQGTSVQRKFGQLDLKLYYSSRTGTVATSAGATIGSVNATSNGAGGVVFTAQVLGDPNAGIQDVWVTYTKDDGFWKSVSLSNCVAPLPPGCGTSTDSRMWAGSPPELVSSARYVVQAATATGLVSLDSNQGAYYLYGFAAPVATTLQISAPSAAVFGSTIPVTVNLKKTADSSALAGKSVLVAIGGGGKVAVTQGDGTVVVNVPVIGVVPSATPAQVTATFYGEDALAGSSATTLLASSSVAPVTIAKAPTALTQASVVSPNVGATLTAATQPLPQRSVRFTFAGTRGQPAQNVVALTNNTGTAIAGPPASLIPDTYTVSMQFPATGTDSDPTYQPSSLVLPSGTWTYVVPKYEQSVTVVPVSVPPGGFTYGDQPFPVSASASSGLPVSFGATGGACSVSPTTANNAMVQIDSGGSCTVTASQTAAGSLDYNPAPNVVVLAVTIAKSGQTIVFGPLVDKTFGDTAFAVSASASSGLAVAFSASGPCSISGNSVTITGAGNCTVTAAQAGDGRYNPAADVAQTFAIGKAGQAITFGPLGAKTFGDAAFAVSASASSGLAVTFAASGPCSVSGNSVTINGAGNCTVTASQAGNSNYNAAADVAQSFTVAKAAQTIAFGALGGKTYGDAPIAVSATASSGLAVTFGAAGSCTIAGNTVTITGAGSCTITASQGGNANFSAAPDVPQSFAIAKASQTISFAAVSPAPTFATGGTGTFAVSATAPGGTVTFSVPTTGAVCTVAGTTVTMKAAGFCTLVADQPGSANYTPAPSATQSVLIGKAAQTITFANPGDKTLATPSFALVGTASSGLPVTFAASGSCTVSGTTLTLTATGSCTVTPSQSGDTNYAPVTGAAQTFKIDLANVWTLLTARMTKPRLFHTATRLETGPLAGQVLIAGGIERTGTRMQSSELYNPTTRTFVAVTNNMPGKVSDHTATLLQSGKVIVLGGGYASAQMFDPAAGATGTWSSGGAPALTLIPNRSNHTATRLPSGKVLFVGGADSSGNTLKSTIVYDPAGAGSFAAGPVLDTARERHTATLLQDGKVLIVGGRAKSGTGYTTHATYQICDATTCTSSTGSVGNRHSHAAVALGPDGSKVVVAGGANGSTALATAALFTYNATTGSGTWSTSGLGSLAMARSELTLSELPNGRALAAGGINGIAVKGADAYGPPIAPVAPMNVARAGHTATVLKDTAGNLTGILVAGGGEDNADNDDALDWAEIYGTQ